MLKYENKYLMIKQDNTYSVFESDDDVPKKYKASQDIVTTYLGKQIIIKKDNFFYATDPHNPIIGWHGSVNPPKDMDGNSLIDEKIVTGANYIPYK